MIEELKRPEPLRAYVKARFERNKQVGWRVLECPLCGHQHDHGLTLGHRSAHCAKELPPRPGFSGYFDPRFSRGYVLIAEDTKRAVHVIEEARHREDVLYLEVYCRNSRCPLREMRLHCKDYEGTLIDWLYKNEGIRCPFCEKVLALHWVRTATEMGAVEGQDARSSVNAQMYQRDHGEFGVPASVLMDERLPDTPPGWFAGVASTGEKVHSPLVNTTTVKRLFVSSRMESGT